MNKFFALRFSQFWIVPLLALAACGRQEPPRPAGAEAEPARAEAPAPAQQAPEASGGRAVSETDEPAADAGAQSSTVQPSVRVAPTPSGPPTSARFREGVNYQKIVPAQATSVRPDQVEVLEVFWYGCGHCFALDPAIESWRKNTLPAYAQLVRVPAMWNETTRIHARLFYTAEALGKLDELHSQIFREIHVNRNPLNTVEAISAFFRQHGVSEDQFTKTFSSFAVESKLQRADFLNRRYRIQSVPMFVVNGKYKTDVSEAGGESELFTLMGELVAHEHGG